mgnify:FL=1
MTAQKSVAALHIRGWVAAGARGAMINQLVVRHGGQVSTRFSGLNRGVPLNKVGMSPHTHSILGLAENACCE